MTVFLFGKNKAPVPGADSFRVLTGALVDFVLPPRCVVSGRPVERQGMIDPEIWAQINFISEPLCACCGRPFSYRQDSNARCGACLANPPVYSRARAALAYDDGSKPLVLRFKHADQMHAVRAFLPWLKRAGADILAEADYLVPVPLHRWRLARRRYNQAGIIAAHLARDTGVPFLPDPLIRLRHTPPQGVMGAKERSSNVRKAFVIRDSMRSRMEGKNIVLIDDVFTTGATVSECAAMLVNAGCAKVDVLTLARTVRPD